VGLPPHFPPLNGSPRCTSVDPRQLGDLVGHVSAVVVGPQGVQEGAGRGHTGAPVWPPMGLWGPLLREGAVRCWKSSWARARSAAERPARPLCLSLNRGGGGERGGGKGRLLREGTKRRWGRWGEKRGAGKGRLVREKTKGRRIPAPLCLRLSPAWSGVEEGMI